jgi:hypothetical protein
MSARDFSQAIAHFRGRGANLDMAWTGQEVAVQPLTLSEECMGLENKNPVTGPAPGDSP